VLRENGIVRPAGVGLRPHAAREQVGAVIGARCGLKPDRVVGAAPTRFPVQRWHAI